MIKISPLPIALCALLMLLFPACRIVPASEVLDQTTPNLSEPAPESEPHTDLPETDSPESTVPETTSPETTAPETTVPETTAPETELPGSVGIAYWPHYGTGTCTITGMGDFAGSTLEIPDTIDGLTVTVIGKDAFADQIGLTAVILPSTLTTIEAGAFSGCRNLTEIALPASLNAIGAKTFSGCSSLASVTFAEPEGWMANGTSQDALGDPQTAAILLRSLGQTDWQKTHS